jgi:hypothetical protein
LRERDVSVKFKDLLEAFQVSDFGAGSEECVTVCRRTGQIYWPSDEMLTGIPPDDLPDDVNDEEKYFQLPGKKELGLGKPVALDFAREFLPQAFDDVRYMFSRRGAYPRFHALLMREGLRERWHVFEAAAEERALREWCVDMEIELSE